MDNFTLGWQFTTDADVNITALGVFDFGHDGLITSHDIGIRRVSA